MKTLKITGAVAIFALVLASCEKETTTPEQANPYKAAADESKALKGENVNFFKWFNHVIEADANGYAGVEYIEAATKGNLTDSELGVIGTVILPLQSATMEQLRLLRPIVSSEIQAIMDAYPRITGGHLYRKIEPSNNTVYYATSYDSYYIADNECSTCHPRKVHYNDLVTFDVTDFISAPKRVGWLMQMFAGCGDGASRHFTCGNYIENYSDGGNTHTETCPESTDPQACFRKQGAAPPAPKSPPILGLTNRVTR